jgi:hypothetical protein
MNIERTAVAEFWVGHGGADAVARPLVQRGYAPEKALKGVRVRAATGNTAVVYVGPAGVTVDSGYPLPAGKEVEVEIADVSKVYVTASPAGNSQQHVVLAGTIAGESFTLSLNDVPTAPISTGAAAADVKTAVEGVVGAGNVDVSGDPGGPYTVEFKGALAKTDVALMDSTDGGINARQTVAVTGGTAGDNVVLSYDGQSTAELAYNTSSADLQTALRALSSINGANVAVTDGDPAGWVVEFIGNLAKADVSAISGVCGKNEKQTVVVTGGAAGDKLVLTYNGQSTAELAYDIASADLQTALRALSSVNGANVAVTDGDPAGWVVEFIGTLAKSNVPAITGVGGKNEKQTITLDPGVSDGTFTLTYDGQTTPDLAYNISAADMQTALWALSSINGANVAVTDGDPSGWVVEFIGILAHTDASAITGDGTNLVGDVKTVTVLETVKGNTATVNVTETVQGHLATVNITETVKGNLATVNVTETVLGHLATVSVTMTQQGDAGFTVAVTKVTDASAGSNYSWIAC